MRTWHEIKNQLEQGCSLYLLTVVESTGSAPGRVGFKMLVSESNYLFGSIGGGIMEYNLVEKAKQWLNDNIVQHITLVQDHHGQSNSSSGMICSGSQTIAFNHLSANDLQPLLSVLESSSIVELSDKGVLFHPKNKQQEELIQQLRNDKEHWYYL